MARKDFDKKFQVNAVKFVWYILHNPNGDFCVWLKALSDVFSGRIDLKQQHNRDIATFKYLMFLQCLSEQVLLKTVCRIRQNVNLL